MSFPDASCCFFSAIRPDSVIGTDASVGFICLSLLARGLHFCFGFLHFNLSVLRCFCQCCLALLPLLPYAVIRIAKEDSYPQYSAY